MIDKVHLIPMMESGKNARYNNNKRHRFSVIKAWVLFWSEHTHYRTPAFDKSDIVIQINQASGHDGQLFECNKFKVQSSKSIAFQNNFNEVESSSNNIINNEKRTLTLW